jgi:hypothetical protein
LDYNTRLQFKNDCNKTCKFLLTKNIHLSNSEERTVFAQLMVLYFKHWECKQKAKKFMRINLNWNKDQILLVIM